MIKVNKDKVRIIGFKNTVLAELSQLVQTLAEKDRKGVIIALSLGLGYSIDEIIGMSKEEDK